MFHTTKEMMEGAVMMNTSKTEGKIALIKNLLSRLKSKKIDNKFKIILILAIIIGSILIVQYKNYKEYQVYAKAFEVVLENESIGIVREKETISEIIKNIKDEFSQDDDIEVLVHGNISFKDTYAEDSELTSVTQLKNKIKSSLKIGIGAYAIRVNGKDLGIVKSRDIAVEILESIKRTYIDNKREDSEIQEIKFAEDVEIVRVETDLSKIQESEEVLSFLQKGTNEEKIHIVEKGENFWNIAKKYNLTVDDLIKANPDKSAELIHPGDELSLIVPKPYITVVTYEKATYVQDIKYDTNYEYSSTMYEDESKVKRKGVPGKSEVVAKVEKHNGIEVSKEILQEKIISKPVAQIVVKGTKELPPLKGTGSFIRPVVGTLTSRFGMRWGRMHNGIDMAARTGTPIRAADGGVVTYAGWRSSYGYLVEIDHGGGFKTRYAHCSKIYVKKGEKVYKGKVIAAVGNTGRSTGPHLHFEVLKHGEPQNPSKYIGKKYR